MGAINNAFNQAAGAVAGAAVTIKHTQESEFSKMNSADNSALIARNQSRAATAEANEAINEAKKVLAYEVTKLVHGEEAARQAQEATEALFGGNAKDMSNVPAIEITSEDMTAKIIDVLTAAKVFSSKREARQLIAQGGLTVADTVLQDAEACLSADMFDADKSLLIRKGKKKYFRLLVK